ncbi:helix-turn-helix domain-containing protein [Bacillus sp. FJAT-50079]|uniref:helix-turn-helix domain-containing protein n=1 Tax=Bacillus sp. FJAT-50079 TaxID=2833577 RepID=UPI001BCA0390|nr:helix-turn-helix domain-containing protein [Bacillus sp. FJAT-50079]MBS4208201.1 helix-turn-helix domain-containing protein [Bacillus sp. FJAT-50079]
MNFSDYYKKCYTLHSITKMDVRLLNEQGKPKLELVEHHIPAVLSDVEEEYDSILRILQKNDPHSYYYYINSYGLEFIATGIWKNSSIHGFMLIGPFLSSIPGTIFMSELLYKNKLPVSERHQLHQFYQSLTIISSNDSRKIGHLLVNICAHPHIDSQLIISDVKPQERNKEHEKRDRNENQQVIELRYKLEKKLIHLIKKGDKSGVSKILKQANSLFTLSDRIPESPIRSAKNLLLVLNTICRIAAEQGGVHPVHVHTISEKYAILIERAPNLPDLQKLFSIMVNDYCDTVIKRSKSQYSLLIKKATEYIDLHLEEPLTLQYIATILHVTPSHLSRTFKEDTNMSIIDYINDKRIEEAKLYLHQGDISITEIAFMVGYNDPNYFSRTFKKVTSLTPSQYIKMNGE